MTTFKKIVTHPGGAHKDEFLACALLIAEHGTPVLRRDPDESDLSDPEIAVVDVGHRHEPELGNFDHHQFPRDAEPSCALSLVLQYLNLYEDACAFCEWLEPAEWFDCRGAIRTAEWLGVERDVMFKLNSPIDFTVLKRFAAGSEWKPGDVIWEMMRMIGEDLLTYIRGMRERVDGFGQYARIEGIQMPDQADAKIIYIGRSDTLPEDATQGLSFYLKEQGIEDSVVAIISPDSRGEGYGMRRYEDHPKIDFNRIADQPDAHFVHKSGFLAKVTATEKSRLLELLHMAVVS
ncbi:MAG: MYG1 family protein [Opitutales bacterium]